MQQYGPGPQTGEDAKGRSTKTIVIAVLAVAAVVVIIVSAVGALGGEGPGAIEGRTWSLVSYAGQPILEGTEITAQFAGGRVSGVAGCNQYSGSYQLTGGGLSLGPLITTKKACADPEGIMDQELTFVQFLQDAQTFRLTDEQLQIFTSDSEALTFIPPE